MEKKEQKDERKEENQNKSVLNRQKAAVNYVVKWLRNNKEENSKGQHVEIRVEEDMEIGCWT